LTEISPGVYDLKMLENLFVNNNHITTVDPFKIIDMKNLSTLNLQNNDLMQIPVELGKAVQLK
jgi:Leucine-rich repeat (LRR) protein